MGQAKQRGSQQERVAQARAEGRIKATIESRKNTHAPTWGDLTDFYKQGKELVATNVHLVACYFTEQLEPHIEDREILAANTGVLKNDLKVFSEALDKIYQEHKDRRGVPITQQAAAEFIKIWEDYTSLFAIYQSTIQPTVHEIDQMLQHAKRKKLELETQEPIGEAEPANQSTDQPASQEPGQQPIAS